MNNESSGVRDERPSLCVRPRADGDVEECVRVLAEVHARDGYPVNWPDQREVFAERPGVRQAGAGAGTT